MSTPGFGFGRSPFEEFDELMSRYFGGSGPASPPRRAQRVDIGSLLSERARELVAEARDIAAVEGSEELDARHLLAAATEQESTRRLLAEAGADPDRIRERLTAGEGSGPKTEPTTLTPAAKRALLDAYQISRAEDSSYIGPEHLLRALAANPESAAGRPSPAVAGRATGCPPVPSPSGRSPVVRRPSTSTGVTSPRTPAPGGSTR